MGGRAVPVFLVAVGVSAISATALADFERGTPGPDKLVGTRQADKLLGRSGADKLTGRGGRDRLSGGKGRDRLRGNRGEDRLLGNRGPDRLLGGRGADLLLSGPGGGVVNGGLGPDQINTTNGELIDAPGDDRILARDGSEDEINCGDGDDVAVVDLAEEGVLDCETVFEPGGRVIRR